MRSKNWLAMLEACLGDIEKVANFLQEFVQRRKDGSISQGDVDELFNSKQMQTYFKGGQYLSENFFELTHRNSQSGGGKKM